MHVDTNPTLYRDSMDETMAEITTEDGQRFLVVNEHKGPSCKLLVETDKSDTGWFVAANLHPRRYPRGTASEYVINQAKYRIENEKYIDPADAYDD